MIGIAKIVIKDSNNCKSKHNGTTVYGNKGAVFKTRQYVVVFSILAG